MGGVAHDESPVSFRVSHRLQSGAHALQHGHRPVAVAPGRQTIEVETERKENGSGFRVPGSKFGFDVPVLSSGCTVRASRPRQRNRSLVDVRGTSAALLDEAPSTDSSTLPLIDYGVHVHIEPRTVVRITHRAANRIL